jgi:protein SCO1/2
MKFQIWARTMTLFSVAGVCIGLVACGSQPRQSGEASSVAALPAQTETARYDLRGKVVAVDKAAKRLTVDHEAITGFMGAMTMAYPVKDDHLLDGLSAGDQVTARVVSAGGSYWLEDFKMTKRRSEVE